MGTRTGQGKESMESHRHIMKMVAYRESGCHIRKLVATWGSWLPYGEAGCHIRGYGCHIRKLVAIFRLEVFPYKGSIGVMEESSQKGLNLAKISHSAKQGTHR